MGRLVQPRKCVTIQSLLFIIAMLNIDFKYEDLHLKDPTHDGFAWPARRIIRLDVSLQGTWSERCVLAEEIAHCLFSLIGDNILYHSRAYWDLPQDQRDSIRWWVSKDERAAMLWATSKIISNGSFMRFAARGPHEWREWLEEFEVPSWFMMEKFGIVRAKMQEDRLRPFRWRDLVVR